jgi:hypothetical protein
MPRQIINTLQFNVRLTLSTEHFHEAHQKKKKSRNLKAEHNPAIAELHVIGRLFPWVELSSRQYHR